MQTNQIHIRLTHPIRSAVIGHGIVKGEGIYLRRDNRLGVPIHFVEVNGNTEVLFDDEFIFITESGETIFSGKQ